MNKIFIKIIKLTVLTKVNEIDKKFSLLVQIREVKIRVRIKVA